ncbi:hypothetical protein BLOT_003985 [Blomia tropicalis]|nr:hypothetical protein BLOT_003985 [Blomia tropicalis]
MNVLNSYHASVREASQYFVQYSFMLECAVSEHADKTFNACLMARIMHNLYGFQIPHITNKWFTIRNTTMINDLLF